MFTITIILNFFMFFYLISKYQAGDYSTPDVIWLTVMILPILFSLIAIILGIILYKNEDKRFIVIIMIVFNVIIIILFTCWLLALLTVKFSPVG